MGTCDAVARCSSKRCSTETRTMPFSYLDGLTAPLCSIRQFFQPPVSQVSAMNFKATKQCRARRKRDPPIPTPKGQEVKSACQPSLCAPFRFFFWKLILQITCVEGFSDNYNFTFQRSSSVTTEFLPLCTICGGRNSFHRWSTAHESQPQAPSRSNCWATVARPTHKGYARISALSAPTLKPHTTCKADARRQRAVSHLPPHMIPRHARRCEAFIQG